MNKQEIAIETIKMDGADLTKRCILVTSGTFEEGKFNTMTVNWGFFGTMWYDPSVLLVIRPSRYTFEYIERCHNFTLTILPEKYKEVYTLMGSKSGRDSDKVKESGLTPIRSMKVESPSFEEACYTMECEATYIGDLQAEGILVSGIMKRDYPNGDFHKMIIGKIVNAWKTEEF